MLWKFMQSSNEKLDEEGISGEIYMLDYIKNVSEILAWSLTK